MNNVVIMEHRVQGPRLSTVWPFFLYHVARVQLVCVKDEHSANGVAVLDQDLVASASWQKLLNGPLWPLAVDLLGYEPK
jgi:hypothetical protein